jgi:hypothetical protein
MNRLLKALFKRTPFLRGLDRQIQMQGAFPAGHYYSPIPSDEDVNSYLKSRKSQPEEISSIDLNEIAQRDLLNEFIGFYPDIPFSEQKLPASRYYYNNDYFCYSDAIFLYCFMKKYKPRRIIEVGSGFSSAAMLDTVDSCFSQRPEITFIEPYPDRLMSLIKPEDKQLVRLIDKKIQDISPDTLLTLQAGDFLFIDSSHVVKCGSDLQFLMFEILPRLQPGVFVHFHDVFYPFDYPSDWLLQGRYWNENYFLRAFLSYNSEWRIQFFNTYVHFKFGNVIREKMPLCAKNTGGSLYIQRVSAL